MSEVVVDLIHEQSNCCIVQLPARSFPGIVVQGDTVNHMAALVKSIKTNIDLGNFTEAVDECEELGRELKGFQDIYEVVCIRHNRKLPYPANSQGKLGE